MIIKKFKHSCILILLMIIAFSTFSTAEPNNAVTPESSKNETLNAELVTFRETNVSSSDVKNDDVFLSGADVTIEQEVYGNVYAAATNKLTISAPIYGNVYAAGKTIEFKNISDSSKPVYVSGSVYLYGSTSIDLSIYCQELYVYSPASLTISYDSCIDRDIRASVSDFNLYGIVNRNVFLSASNISMENDKNEKGLINGNLTYSNHKELSISKELVVGDITFNLKTIDNTPSWLKNLYVFIVRFICTVLFLAILTRTSPKIVHPEKGFILKKFLGNCLYSIVMLIAIPLVCILLVYFAPRFVLFSLPIMFIYAAFIVIGFFTTLIYITGLLEKKFQFKSIWISICILFGINFVLYILSFIPSLIFSLILTLVLVIPGFGLLTSQLLEKNDSVIDANSKNNKRKK